MKPGVHAAGWSETFATVLVAFQTIRLITEAAENPIAAELHRIRKSPKSSSCTGVVRFPR
jgi:hypothetical protein